jgi:hypothetical protein
MVDNHDTYKTANIEINQLFVFSALYNWKSAAISFIFLLLFFWIVLLISKIPDIKMPQ